MRARVVAVGSRCTGNGSRAIWSQWEGYLAAETGTKFVSECQKLGIPLESIHTSGHADIDDLKRFAAAVNAAKLVPIHTFFPERFKELFRNVVLAGDGVWEEV